jgi:hypothetical protein
LLLLLLLLLLVMKIEQRQGLFCSAQTDYLGQKNEGLRFKKRAMEYRAREAGYGARGQQHWNLIRMGDRGGRRRR